MVTGPETSMREDHTHLAVRGDDQLDGRPVAHRELAPPLQVSNLCSIP